jgi:hypothetical protein
MVREANYSSIYLESQGNFFTSGFEGNFRNVTAFISNHFAEFYLTCAQNIYDFYVYYNDKYEEFDSFENFMLGFASNLISYVVYFDEFATQLSEAEETGDDEAMWAIIGKIIALVSEFEVTDINSSSSWIGLGEVRSAEEFMRMFSEQRAQEGLRKSGQSLIKTSVDLTVDHYYSKWLSLPLRVQI